MNQQPSDTPLPQEPQAPGESLPAEVLEWARKRFTEEEIAAGLREIRETGGLKLDDFLHELEEVAGSDD